jgi:pyruvate/2-oxoglutarate dehydrogenase complex dihydrolipoamide acyltransferase (E2) component
MAIIDVLLPQFGMGMQDGEIIRWLKAVGDPVREGDPLVEIEAAKTTVEMPAPASGILTEIVAQEGDTIEVRTVIARISG